MKTVLITGVAGGIGSATADVFARDGWQVLGVDCLSPEGSSSCSEFYVVDLADERSIQRLFAEITIKLGALDAVVNNAAIQLCKPLLETCGDEWDAIMAVNLRAAFLVMQQAHPLLREHNGAIVNVGSVHARATSHSIAAYAASKGGLEALTHAAALEFAPDGIRVNGVHPGAVATTMLEAGLDRGRMGIETTETMLKSLGQKHPLGRVGKPAEIGEVILFLADNTRSSFVTGSFLVADGGALSRLSVE